MNLGTRRVPKLRLPTFPDVGTGADNIRRERRDTDLDILLVNPPSPDGGIWIRSQHRVGRKSRENMIWPQVSLAQMAALLVPEYNVEIIDAIATRMTWKAFEALLREKRPRYYLTQVTASTLTNDMYGVFLAKEGGASTIAFGTHVTPMTQETMNRYPALDFVLRGEPEITLRELLDTLERRTPTNPQVRKLLNDTGMGQPRSDNGETAGHDLPDIKGLAWRRDGEVVINMDRPFIPNLDDLPIPLHDRLPFETYRIPLIKGPYTFIVTSRGCTAGCKFCIKHVSYQYTVRLRSPENIVEEMWRLHDLGIHNVHMYADLFTVNREQVVGLCNLILKEGLQVRWTCNSRVDYVDEEMLQLMSKAGCWFMSWGIESANEAILKSIHKGYRQEQVGQALTWAKQAGIRNWGYFIIGLPGETEETIRQTIAFSKKLPLDLALFHVAAPYPGTPFYFEVVKNGWFRPDTRWEEVDMDRSTVLDYPELSGERLEYWQQRAFREWAFRPGPVWTYAKMLASDPSTLRSALEVGLQHLGWTRGES